MWYCVMHCITNMISINALTNPPDSFVIKMCSIARQTTSASRSLPFIQRTFPLFMNTIRDKAQYIFYSNFTPNRRRTKSLCHTHYAWPYVGWHRQNQQQRVHTHAHTHSHTKWIYSTGYLYNNVWVLSRAYNMHSSIHIFGKQKP